MWCGVCCCGWREKSVGGGGGERVDPKPSPSPSPLYLVTLPVTTPGEKPLYLEYSSKTHDMIYMDCDRMAIG